jgi:hypothetical protein
MHPVRGCGALCSLYAQTAWPRLPTWPEHDQRFSFCCAIDAGRKRKTPVLLRVLGRKVYLAATVVLNRHIERRGDGYHLAG